MPSVGDLGILHVEPNEGLRGLHEAVFGALLPSLGDRDDGLEPAVKVGALVGAVHVRILVALCFYDVGHISCLLVCLVVGESNPSDP